MNKLLLILFLLIGGIEIQASISNTVLPIPKSERKFMSIFFEDSENDLLYIDFEAVQDPIITIKLLKRKKVVLKEEVSDLPANTIYELELNQFKKGKYTLELTTKNNTQILRKIHMK